MANVAGISGAGDKEYQRNPAGRSRTGYCSTTRLTRQRCLKAGTIILQSDEDRNQFLRKFPKHCWTRILAPNILKRSNPNPMRHCLSGYRQPWAAGLSKRLTGSIGHVFTYKTCPATCLYAFDLPTEHVDIVLQKPVRSISVWHMKRQHVPYQLPDIEDVTTSPTNLSDLLSSGQNSIPEDYDKRCFMVSRNSSSVTQMIPVSAPPHCQLPTYKPTLCYWGKSVRHCIVSDINGADPDTPVPKQAPNPVLAQSAPAATFRVQKRGRRAPHGRYHLPS